MFSDFHSTYVVFNKEIRRASAKDNYDLEVSGGEGDSMGSVAPLTPAALVAFSPIPGFQVFSKPQVPNPISQDSELHKQTRRTPQHSHAATLVAARPYTSTLLLEPRPQEVIVCYECQRGDAQTAMLAWCAMRRI